MNDSTNGFRRRHGLISLYQCAHRPMRPRTDVHTELSDFSLLSFNVRVVAILSVWVEFDELYFSHLLKMLDL